MPAPPLEFQGDALREATFIQRLSALQRLCSSTESNLPHALLIVAGADGRNNKASNQLIKYLFFGSTGKDLLDGFLDTEYEALEEMVLLLQESSVSIIWTHEAKRIVGSKLVSYPFLVEYIPSKVEEDEIDLFQARKCCDFKRMMLEAVPAGRGIGIPIPLGYDNVQDVESWPLLQSFAMDGVYCATGFFTARYNVFDVSEYLDVRSQILIYICVCIYVTSFTFHV